MIELRMVFRPPSSTTSGHFSLAARETWIQSLLYRLTLNQGPHSQYPFLQRILKIYFGTVLAIGALGGLAWIWRTG